MMVVEWIKPKCMHCGIEWDSRQNYECPQCHPKMDPAPAETGHKHNDGKAPMELLPRAALEGAAKAMATGVPKYGAWDWAKGESWSEYAAKAIRHIYAFLDGEDDDPESGLSHVAHGLADLMILSHYVQHPELYAEAHDDRRGSD